MTSAIGESVDTTADTHSPLVVNTDVVERLLDLARTRTGMELSWMSSFRDGLQVIDVLSGDAAPFGLSAGAWCAHADSYGVRVLDGRLPNVIPDTLVNPLTMELAGTHDLGIGSYIGVPIPGAESNPPGMLCCVSAAPNRANGDAEIRFLELLSRAIAEVVSDTEQAEERKRRIRDRVGTVLRRGGLTAVYQPIMALQTGRIVGVEGLARFPAEPRRPDIWFMEAESVGLGIALELAAVETALAGLDHLPSDVYLSVNASPALLCHPDLTAVLAMVRTERIVVELTEHAAVNDYDDLVAAIKRLRLLGARLAIDDVGAGFSSFNHVLRLEPDILKLDMSLTRNIDRDAARRGLALGLLSVAHYIGATVVAEGVETQGELDALLGLGVDAAQGYFLARPGSLPLPTALPRPTPRLFGTKPERGSEGDALALVARTWFEADDLESVTRPLLRAVLDRTGLQSSFLAIRQPASGDLERRYVRNAGDLDLPEGLVIPWDDTLCKRCRDADINWTADVPADVPGCQTAEELGVQTFLSVPIHDGTGVEIGSLCAASTDSRVVGAATVAEVKLIARLIADYFPA